MSHYRNIKTKITNTQALIRALTRVPNRNNQCFKVNQIQVHEQAKHLYGYQNDQRADVANLIIHRQYVGEAANDLGFIREKNGTSRAIISDYDSGHYNEGWLKKLYTYYGVECAKMQCEARKIPYKEFVDPNDPQKRPRLLATVN